MESPYNRPIACDLIGKTLDDYQSARIKEPNRCGGSLELAIYHALLQAGYLTEAAQVREPYPQ